VGPLVVLLAVLSLMLLFFLTGMWGAHANRLELTATGAVPETP